MHNTTAEYLPSESERFGHRNGNGNGHHEPKFGIVKAPPDPDTVAVLESRRACRAEPNDKLNRSAKSCFDEIADRALNPAFYDYKGVVTISDTVLAEVFSVSPRTVFTWKTALESAGYVWLTRKPKSNMWPITTYHLSCLHKPRREAKTDSDGTYGGGRYRSAPANPGQGARRPGQPGLTLPGSRTHPPDGKIVDLQPISGESRKKDRLSPEEKIGSEPKPASGESRRKDRARAEASFGREPKPASGESRSRLPVGAEAGFRHIKAKGEESGTFKGVGQGDPPQGNAWEAEFEKWRASLPKKFDRELRATLDDLKADRQKLKEFPPADAPEKLRRVKLKIEAVNAQLTGPR